MLDWYDSRSTVHQRWLLMGLCLMLLATVQWHLLVFGYLASEEGSTYLRYARAAGTWRALVAPHQGYYALLPNFFTLLPARFLPLLWAPWMATWSAFGVRLWAAWFVSTCEAFLLGRTRLIVAMLLMIAPGSQTALGTIHSQFFLGTIAIVILASDPSRHKLSRFSAIVLGGLSGAVTCFFLPFFLWRAWRRPHLVTTSQALSISVCTVVQAFIMRSALPYTSRETMRVQAPWVYVDALLNHVLFLPFLTRATYHVASVWLERGGALVWIGIGAIMLIFAAWIARLVWPGGNDVRLVLSAALFSSVCSVGSMEGGHAIAGGGERYFIVGVSAVLLAIALSWERLSEADLAWRRRSLRLMLLLFSLSTCVDLVRYRFPSDPGFQWRAQVEAFRVDPTSTFHNGGSAWAMHRYTLADQPLSIRMPYYIYDSGTRDEVVRQLPRTWFGPLSSETRPEQLLVSVRP